MKAVRFNGYGDINVLQVAEVPTPVPSAGQVLVRVKAASINPGEAKIREGLLQQIFPATFPSGEGSDFAGIVVIAGPSATQFKVGDEVFGFTNHRASHAEYVAVEEKHLARKPAQLSWEVAGSLGVAGCTAYATIQAVALKPGQTVAIAGAAGGVGSIAVQLARRAGAKVIGIASPATHEWLREHGVHPMNYGEGLADRLRGARPDALIDAHGGGYVKLAIELGIARDRIDTIIDFDAARKYGVQARGSESGMNASVLAELGRLAASGELEVPIAARFALEQVRDAFELLERGHTHGKIVLMPELTESRKAA